MDFQSRGREFASTAAVSELEFTRPTRPMSFRRDTVRSAAPFYTMCIPIEVNNPKQGNGNMSWTHCLSVGSKAPRPKPSTKDVVPDLKLWPESLTSLDVCRCSVDEERTAVEVFGHTMATVKFNGHIYWSMPVLFKSSCKFHPANYPFDVQVCPLTFGSWNHNSKEVSDGIAAST